MAKKAGDLLHPKGHLPDVEWLKKYSASIPAHVPPNCMASHAGIHLPYSLRNACQKTSDPRLALSTELQHSEEHS